MTQNLLSEPEAWRRIAQRFDRRSERYPNLGLCADAWALWYEGRIDHYLVLKMVGRASDHASLSPDATDHHGGTYAFPPGKHRRARILAALFLALEAEDELRAAPDTRETT